MGSIEVPLENNKNFALIDEEDYDKVCKFKWRGYSCNSNTMYALTPIYYNRRKTRLLRMHHLIFGKPPNGLVTDHINKNGLDNRKQNLRFCTCSQNAVNLNLPYRKRNGKLASKFIGVRKNCRKWQVTIRIKGVIKSMGQFVTEEEAARRYDQLALQLYGIHAKLNFKYLVCRK